MKDYEVSSENQTTQTMSWATGEDNILGEDFQPQGANLQPQITALPLQSAEGKATFHAQIWPLEGDHSERYLSLDARSAVSWHSSAGSEPGAWVAAVWSGHHRADPSWHCSNTVSTGNNIRWVGVLVQLNTTLHSAWHVGSFKCVLFRRSSLCSSNGGKGITQ